MPESKLLPVLVILLIAMTAWAALYFLCGRWGRRYAVAGFATAFFVGLNWWYDLPSYGYVLGILIAPFFFHRSVRGRQARSARRVDPLELPALGVALRWSHDLSGRRLAEWRVGAAPGLARDPAGAPVPPGEPSASAAPRTLVLWLEFQGLAEDQYEIALCAALPRVLRGSLIVHHRDAAGHCREVLDHLDPVEGITGQEAWMAVRSAPRDFSCQILDIKSLALLHEVFRLQSEEREMYVQVEGDKIRIGSSAEFDEPELGRFLADGASWIQRIREQSLIF